MPSEPINLFSLDRRDELFSSPLFPQKFEFNEEVVRVFDDMVLRSIPLYKEILNCISGYADNFYQADTALIDIGCSTGTTMLAIGQSLPHAHFLGIDSSPAMIAAAKAKFQSFFAKAKVEFVCDDALNAAFPTASFAVMNYTMQFVPVKNRTLLIKKIFDALLPGGALFISEKIRFYHPLIQETTTSIYEDFKFKNGYSRHEIARKKESLEHVLIPNTRDDHLRYLNEAGFNIVEPVFQWNNFLSMIAIK